MSVKAVRWGAHVSERREFHTWRRKREGGHQLQQVTAPARRLLLLPGLRAEAVGTAARQLQKRLSLEATSTAESTFCRKLHTSALEIDEGSRYRRPVMSSCPWAPGCALGPRSTLGMQRGRTLPLSVR